MSVRDAACKIYIIGGGPWYYRLTLHIGLFMILVAASEGELWTISMESLVTSRRTLLALFAIEWVNQIAYWLRRWCNWMWLAKTIMMAGVLYSIPIMHSDLIVRVSGMPVYSSILWYIMVSYLLSTYMSNAEIFAWLGNWLVLTEAVAEKLLKSMQSEDCDWSQKRCQDK